MAFGSIALLPLMLLSNKYRGGHITNIKRNWRALVFIGCVNGPQIALNNASLVKIELSLNQVSSDIGASIALTSRLAHCLPSRSQHPPHGITLPGKRTTHAPICQVIRAAIPVCVAFFAFCLERRVSYVLTPLSLVARNPS